MVTKELLLEGLKESLRGDAKKHIEKGTITLPVDPEEFATRLEKVAIGTGLEHEDYVQAIRDVCEELDLRVKDAG